MSEMPLRLMILFCTEYKHNSILLIFFKYFDHIIILQIIIHTVRNEKGNILSKFS